MYKTELFHVMYNSAKMCVCVWGGGGGGGAGGGVRARACVCKFTSKLSISMRSSHTCILPL